MKKILGLFIIFILISGCSKKTSNVYAPDVFGVEGSAPVYSDMANVSTFSSNELSEKRAAKPTVSHSVAKNSFNADSITAEAEESNASINQSDYERKLIKNGDISIEVSDLQKVQSSIENWVKKFGGYISNSSIWENNSNYTVRIPCANFDQAMNEVSGFGKIKNRNISVQDVSEQFYDLQSRLSTKKILKEKLNGYLSKATSMQDILKVESQLNSVQSEIESMEGRLKRLNSQIDFSTINVYVNLPYKAVQGGGFELPDFKNNVRHFVSNIISYFSGFVSLIFYLIICGIPAIALISFLFWLLFGKVGLLIKLYKKLKK